MYRKQSGALGKKLSREGSLRGDKSGPGRIKLLQDLGIRLNNIDDFSDKRPKNFFGKLFIFKYIILIDINISLESQMITK